MRLTFFGGAQEVGRAAILLEERRKNVLLDCGIKLGEETEYPLIHDDELKRIRNITISHAHLDHSGYLPHVYSKKLRPKVFLTKPTRDLMGILLADYQRIHESVRGRRRLFTIKDVEAVLKDALIQEYNEPFGNGFRMMFYPAGHIMGSAMTLIKTDSKRILFSGDICMRKTRVLDPCKRNVSADTLIVESTYGGKDDIIPSYKESYQKLIKVVNRALDKGGHVIIPSFAVGRAQEVLLALDDYMRSGALKQAKIYIEGMIGKTMKAYRHNAFYANEDIRRRILMSEDDPFNSPNFFKSRNKNREDVLKEPSIIVTTSGMLTGGPVHFYLDKLGNDPKNTMIFVGYQAKGTPGHKIINGQRRIRIRDKELNLKLGVERVQLSGHADFNELLQFIRSVKGLKKVFLMHGEKTDLVQALEKKYEVVMPRLLETYPA